MEPLKYRYNEDFYNAFLRVLKPLLPALNKKKFLKLIFDESWDGLELKDRMRHSSHVLHEFMPSDFAKASKLIVKLAEQLIADGQTDKALEYMFLPDYLEVYGGAHFEESMSAFEKVTELASCEFAVRPLIIANQKKALARMLKWSKDSNLNMRRLASEGCRPRLPWAMALPELKKDPKPILPILENLKNDDSEYVRRSVANNLNDVSKDHPDLALKLGKKWLGKTKETDALVKHAMRTLLKAGDSKAMALFGFGPENLAVENLKIHNPKLKVGEYLTFGFDLLNQRKKASVIRVEYGIYFQKANGSLSRKVFKISEKEYAAASSNPILRKQSFKPISTRVYHAGRHEVAVIINGKEMAKAAFELEV